MKKWLMLCVMSLVLLCTAVPAYAVDVFIDGKPLQSDVPPQIVSGRTMVPLRAVFEALNADVRFEREEGQASANIWIYKDKKTIGLSMNMTTGQGWPATYVIDNSTGTEKRSNIYLDSPPYLYGGRTMVPLRFIAESFGANVDYNNGVVRIVTQGSGQFSETYKSVLEGGMPARLSQSDKDYLRKAVRDSDTFIDRDNKILDFASLVTRQPVNNRSEGYELISKDYLLMFPTFNGLQEASFNMTNPELKDTLSNLNKIIPLYTDTCAKAYGRAAYTGTLSELDAQMIYGRANIIIKDAKIIEAYRDQL